MAFRNVRLEIRVGNVESRIVGPAPHQALDRDLNPHLRRKPETNPIHGKADRGKALVYDATRGRFLSGALPRVKRLLRREGIRFRIRDLREVRRRTTSWRVRGYDLRGYQREVVRRALETGQGLIDIGTGGGKTLLAAAIIAKLGLPTLYLVTTRTLLHQTVKALETYLGVTPGIIGEGVRQPERLTVALIQGLDPEQVDLSEWSGGTLVIDEGHHAAAASYQELIRRIGARHHFYLSAVPFRSGGDQAVLDALAGRPLTAGKFSAQFLIERGYACPVQVHVERCRIRGDMREKPFTDLYREFIVDNAARNRRVAEIAGRESEAERAVLVLVEHVRHGEGLMALLPDGAAFAHGSVPSRELRATTAAFAAGDIRCLVATSGLFTEGVSIDGIHVLIQAGGLKSRSKVIQTVGRGMRLTPGKPRCDYFDFFDDDASGVLRGHARQRLRVLKEEGFFVPPIEERRRWEDDDEDIPTTWAHVAGTKRFYRVDGDGRITAKAVCVRKEMVPETICKRCRSSIPCAVGGRTQWRAPRD